MLGRRETIIQLLRWYPDAIGGGGGSLDWIGSGPGSKLLQFGPLWYEAPRTWRALETSLGQLRSAKPWTARHLVGRYWQTYEARREVKFVRKGRDELVPLGLRSNEEPATIGGATKSKLTLDCVVRSWPSWVMAAEVDRGLLFLERVMPDPAYLPKSLLEMAA